MTHPDAPARQVALPSRWLRTLVSVLGGFEVLMALRATPVLTAVGVLGGLALLVAPWLLARARPVGLLLVGLGTVPFAALTWWTLVGPLLAVVALVLVAAASRRSHPPVPARP